MSNRDIEDAAHTCNDLARAGDEDARGGAPRP